MNANKLLEDLREVDLFNPDSINYGNRKHYIDQLESVIHQQQAEIEALKAERTTMFGFIKSRGEVGQLIVYKASLEAQEK